MKQLGLIALFLTVLIGVVLAYQIPLTYSNLEGTWVFDYVDPYGNFQSESSNFYDRGPDGILFRFSSPQRGLFEGYVKIFGSDIYVYSNDYVCRFHMRNCVLEQTDDRGTRFAKLSYTNDAGLRGYIITYK